jgi:hypothetical protein
MLVVRTISAVGHCIKHDAMRCADCCRQIDDHEAVFQSSLCEDCFGKLAPTKPCANSDCNRRVSILLSYCCGRCMLGYDSHAKQCNERADV